MQLLLVKTLKLLFFLTKKISKAYQCSRDLPRKKNKKTPVSKLTARLKKLFEVLIILDIRFKALWSATFPEDQVYDCDLSFLQLHENNTCKGLLCLLSFGEIQIEMLSSSRECSTEPIFFIKANTIFRGVTAKKLLTTVQTILIFTERRIEIRNMTSLLAEM